MPNPPAERGTVLTAVQARAAGLSRPMYVVALLALALAINYIDRGAMPTAALQIRHDLGLNAQDYGILFSAFWYFYFWVQIPVGALAERYGAHWVLAGGLVLWAAATMLMGAAAGFTSLLLVRLMLGLGESVGFPCVSKLLACVVPLESLGKANGIVALGYLMAPGIGTFLAGLLINSLGWRAMFVALGAASLLWLVPWSRVKLPKLATARADATTPTWRMVLSQRGLWGTSLGLFSSNYLWYFMLGWLPSYLQEEHGFSMDRMVWVSTAGYVVNGTTALLTGYLVDHYQRRGGSVSFAWKLIMALAHSGSVVFMLIMAWGSQSAAVAGMFGFQVMMGASSAGTYVMGQILAGPKASGRWVGIQNSIGNVPGLISPALTGFVVQRTGHYELAFVIAAVMSALGIVGWLGLVPKLEPLDWARSRRAAETGVAS
ncbi:MAG TPA: MFS transporter [Steroidobacteraceae bacterium]|nr:MFS transporter [Steroidobacteraceae bacterium]